MINPKTEEVFAVSDYFGKLANLIGEYIDFNKGNLSVDERNFFYDTEIELARMAGEMNMIGVNLVFQDVHAMLNQLEEITQEVKTTIKKALAVQEAINIAANLVTIATAIILKDPKAIASSSGALLTSLKKVKA